MLLIALFISLCFSLAPLHMTGNHIENEYIVVLHDDSDMTSFAADISEASETWKERITQTYQHAIKGYAATLTPYELAKIRAHKNVKHVEGNHVITVADCNTVSSNCWGQNRISTRSIDENGKWSFPTTAGNGVNAYILDTGIYTENVDFGGRATQVYKARAEWSNTDRNGHGTHVSSTIGGIKYGIARNTTLLGVKVLSDQGSGSLSDILGGIDFMVADYKKSGKPSVANLSIGGIKSVSENQALNAAVATGITVIVAAGNEDTDACLKSPASAEDVISVGATTIGTNGTTQFDLRTYFSNFGTCVSIFAPGANIIAAGITSPTSTATLSGTSMASPHIAGVCSLILAANPSWNPVSVKKQLLSDATLNTVNFVCSGSDSKVKICQQSPNVFAYIPC